MLIDRPSVGALLQMSDGLGDVSDSPRLDCQLLLANAMNKPRTWLLAHDDAPVADCTAGRFLEHMARRRDGEPLAYITGIKEFWSLEFRVTRDTLIPRPETEVLVESALDTLPNRPARVADLGTGCGAIAVALGGERPSWSLVATDISRAALEVARHNAARLGRSNIEFARGRWCEPLAGEFELIVSNPPYVAPNDPHLERLRHEPANALVSAGSGLADIREIVPACIHRLTRDGALILEHGHDQQDPVCAILKAHAFRDIVALSDPRGRPRAVIARAPERSP